jgi:hypothetical protein
MNSTIDLGLHSVFDGQVLKPSQSPTVMICSRVISCALFRYYPLLGGFGCTSCDEYEFLCWSLFRDHYEDDEKFAVEKPQSATSSETMANFSDLLNFKRFSLAPFLTL